MPHATLTATLLIGLSTASANTATAIPEPYHSSPASSPADQVQVQEFEPSEQLIAINDAVELTKHDLEAFCFVIALPDDYRAARKARDQWIAAQKLFDQDHHPLFFVQGLDAQYVLENAFINSAPASIIFRNGRPYHSRTGALTEKNIQALLALAFDDSAPTTNAPDQTRYLYDSMNQLANEGEQANAAQGACSIMLNLHALIHGPYAISFSASDLSRMNAIYNQSQDSLASLDFSNPAVLDQIESTQAMGLKTWNKRTDSTFGIGIWFDLALVTGDTDPVLDWIDQGLESPVNHNRVAQSLADYGQPLASLLTNTNRFEALAATFTNPEQLNAKFAALNYNAPDQVQSTTEQAAAYHASLLLVGRNNEAWKVAELTQELAGPQLASAALCSAALKVGVLENRHAFLVENLDQTQHASIIRAMNTSFAVVPTDD